MFAIRAIIASGMLAASLGAFAQQPPATPEPPPATEAEQRARMQREVEEAARAIDAYTVARRDEAANRARVALAEMDRYIDRHHAQWSMEAERVRAESRARRERSAARIRERRAAAEARYHAMEQANAEAWTRARERFVRAYHDLAEALGLDKGTSDDSAPDQDAGKDEANGTKDEPGRDNQR